MPSEPANAEPKSSSLKRVFKRLLPFIILALAIGMFLRMARTAEQTPAAVPVEKAWVVATQTITPTSLQPSLPLYGQVTAPRAQQVNAEITATIAALHVLEGQQVAKGELLVQLDSRDAQLALDQARARLRDAQAQLSADNANAEADRQALTQERRLLSLAQAAYNRAQKLKRKDLAAQSRVDDAARGLAQAKLSFTNRELAVTLAESRRARLQAALEQARSSRDQAQLNLSRGRIIAAEDGQISDLRAQLGSRTSPGQTLFTLLPQQGLEIKAQVPAARLQQLQELLSQDQQGLPATGSVGQQTFTARLARVGGAVASGSTGVSIYLQVVSGQQSLQPGRTVSFDLPLPALDNVIKAPREALYGDNRVYLLNDGRMQSTAATVLGEQRQADGSLFILLTGPALTPGGELITTQVPNASDGLRARTADSANAKPKASATGNEPASKPTQSESQ